MASLLRDYDEIKLEGKIYTPAYIVNKILDDTNYKGKQISGKTLLDPACGDGNFLVEVVKRIKKYSDNPARDFQGIHGWDIDVNAINECRKRLNALVSPLKINWNLQVQDSLLLKFNDRTHTHQLFAEESTADCNNKETTLPAHTKMKKFDFIVGNPPYIRIQHLKENQRKYIQQHYSLCGNGSTDIFIAFFELASFCLADTGVCGLITPNSYFTTAAGKKLRDFLANTVRQITNYNHLCVFRGASIYCAITIFGKTPQTKISIQKAITPNKFQISKIENRHLQHQKFWTFDYKPKGKQKLKDICRIYTGIATLADKAYVIKKKKIANEGDDNEYISAFTRLTGEVILEKNALKPIVKGSRYRQHDAPILEYIIFPYDIVGGHATLIKERVLKEKFPKTYNYLLSVKDYLTRRDNGKIDVWYAYGRTQSLVTGFGKKIIFSPMSDKPCFSVCSDANATFYSGYGIKYAGDLYELANKLNSGEMEKYIKTVSRDFRNGWKAYNKTIVQEFMI